MEYLQFGFFKRSDANTSFDYFSIGNKKRDNNTIILSLDVWRGPHIVLIWITTMAFLAGCVATTPPQYIPSHTIHLLRYSHHKKHAEISNCDLDRNNAHAEGSAWVVRNSTKTTLSFFSFQSEKENVTDWKGGKTQYFSQTFQSSALFYRLIQSCCSMSQNMPECDVWDKSTRICCE